MQASLPPQTSANPENISIQAQAALKDAQIKEAYKAAASNFYSIAIFSLINSVISFFQLDIYFPIGLGVTQVIDALAFYIGDESPEIKTIVFIVAMVLDLGFFGIVALFGFFISRKTRWLIPLGGALYLLDGLVLLFFTDWIGAAFHAYFLYRIFVTWQAVRAIDNVEPAPSAIGF